MSDDANDATYASLENSLATLDGQRDALALQMIGLLEGAEINGIPIDQQAAQGLISQAQSLLQQVNGL